jgi:hypothetical protein
MVEDSQRNSIVIITTIHENSAKAKQTTTSGEAVADENAGASTRRATRRFG